MLATPIVAINGTLTRRDPSPGISSSSLTHSADPAMSAFSFGSGRFSSVKNAVVFSKFSNLPLPVRKNDQPQ